MQEDMLISSMFNTITNTVGLHFNLHQCSESTVTLLLIHVCVCVCVCVCATWLPVWILLFLSVSVYLLHALGTCVSVAVQQTWDNMTKSGWIAQTMAESAWQSRRQESNQCLGIYIYTMCPGFKQEAAVCDMCVAERVGLQDCVCATVCACVCASRLELGIGWNFKTSYLARSRHELSV